MLHHFSFTANDPRGVADTLAALIRGRVSRFGPWPGGFIAWAPDEAGTAIEVYPAGTELSPDPGDGQAHFSHNYFAQKHTASHAALSVQFDEDHVLQVAGQAGWRAVKLDRGGFEVIELWIENRTMLEVMTPAMLTQYLAVVDAPRVAASGSGFEPLSLSVHVDTDAATAFRAWTDGEALRSWWPIPDASIDLRIGGPYELLFLPGTADATERGSEGCRILSYVPGRMLSFTWKAPTHLRVGRSITWVAITFTESPGGGTDVELTHNGFLTGPEWDECRTYFRQAWKRVLRRMVDHWQRPAADLTTISDAVAQPAVDVG